MDLIGVGESGVRGHLIKTDFLSFPQSNWRDGEGVA